MEAGGDGRRPLGGWAFWRLLGGLLVLRYLCHALMLLPVLAHERVPAPTLPDLVLAHVPYVPWVARWNYVLWILCYVPPAVWIGLRDRRLLVRLVVTDGALALLRGLMVPLTGLGPVLGPDVNALRPFPLLSTWLAVLNPVTALRGDAAGLYLTKDLFFSGHVATTFLLWLAGRRLGRAGRVLLVLHLATLASVLLGHLHYSIDIVGAYAVTFAAWQVLDRLGPLRRLWGPETLMPS